MTAPPKDGPPRAVVIPFGVPAEGRGLGLGLAALVHVFTHVEGQSVALAQLLSKKPEERVATGPVEAFVPPQAWRELAGTGNTPPDVLTVITGALEPPGEGRGMIQLLAFDARDGKTRGKVERHVDDARAGETLLGGFADLWSTIGGDVGRVRDIFDLGWDALESVLRAERCALHDPVRGGPHDRLAALIHLGRAVADAPDAKFPADRLASLALETALSPSSDARLADAALRALVRAASDAPDHVELLEATAALQVRLGNPSDAEDSARGAILRAPDRPRPYVLLSEARRAIGDLSGALDAVRRGLARSNDQLLRCELGVILAERGEHVEAEGAWLSVLQRDPVHPAAFANLATVYARRGDAVAAQVLVDQALAAGAPHPDVVRRAIGLALATENDGVARAARVARLSRTLLERAPADAWATLMLARAELQMGERAPAEEHLSRVEVLAPGTVLATEAQRGRFALGDPQAAVEVDSALRAAYTAPIHDLEAICVRARRLAREHAVWTAWFAVGIAERRRERWGFAREAFDAAIRSSPGCTPAHMELAGTHISLGNMKAAVAHAERACVLDGPNPRSLGVLATALLADGRREEADAAVTRALLSDPSDAANLALAERIRRKVRVSALARWADAARGRFRGKR